MRPAAWSQSNAHGLDEMNRYEHPLRQTKTPWTHVKITLGSLYVEGGWATKDKLK